MATNGDVLTDAEIIEAVKQEAESYWSRGDEPVEILRVWIEERQSDGDYDVRVEWISDSTQDKLRDDMIYTVTPLDDGTLDIFGPEW